MTQQKSKVWYYSLFLAMALLIIFLLNLVPASSPDDPKFTYGDSRTFSVNNKKLKDRQINAKLISQSKVANFWIDERYSIEPGEIKVINEKFAKKIYPTNIKYFANKNTKNINNINVLITGLGTADGYFSSGDVRNGQQSNLIFLNARTVRNEPSEAVATLSHELAHLIYYLNEAPQNESLDEGLAIFAEAINGNYPYYSRQAEYGPAFKTIEKMTEKVADSGRSVPAFTRLLASGPSTKGSLESSLKDYISSSDLEAFDELINGEDEHEVSLISAFLQFAR